MPSLVRKLLIFAAVDGLILQPAPPRNHPPTTQQAIKVDYKGNVGPLLKDRREEDTAPDSIEAHGIIGTGASLGALRHSHIADKLDRTPKSCDIALPHLHIRS